MCLCVGGSEEDTCPVEFERKGGCGGGGIQDRERGTDMNAKTAVKNNSSLGAGLRKANSIKQQEAATELPLFRETQRPVQRED